MRRLHTALAAIHADITVAAVGPGLRAAERPDRHADRAQRGPRVPNGADHSDRARDRALALGRRDRRPHARVVGRSPPAHVRNTRARWVSPAHRYGRPSRARDDRCSAGCHGSAARSRSRCRCQLPTLRIRLKMPAAWVGIGRQGREGDRAERHEDKAEAETLHDAGRTIVPHPGSDEAASSATARTPRAAGRRRSGARVDRPTSRPTRNIAIIVPMPRGASTQPVVTTG